MNGIDLMSKTSNNAKLQKWSNYGEVHGFHVKTNKNVELRRKPFNTTQIYKSYQNTMNCIDLTSKRSIMLSYVPNNSKQRKSTKVIKIQWIASIWCQNDKKCLVTSQTIQNTAKLQKWSNLRWIGSIWRQNDKKMLSYVPNHSKHSETTKVIKLRWIALIWRQNDQ